MCNTGVGLSPLHAGRLLHFSAGGLYDGLVLLVDDETRTYWDHVTGQAVSGPLAGGRLARFGLEIHGVTGALRRWPDLRLLISRAGVRGRLFSRLFPWMLQKGPLARRFPPGFRKTLGPLDPRLHAHERGLGLIGRREQLFIPEGRLVGGMALRLDDRLLRAGIDEDAGVPFAEEADGTRPLQLWSRWYGFSLSYPDCRIAGPAPDAAPPP